MNPETENWLAGAQYDFETAEHMQKTGRYVYVVFMCHLVIEKALKAIVCEITNSLPPRTHNLVYLMQLASVTLEPRLDSFVSTLSRASVATRYPEELSKIVAQFPKPVTKSYLEQTKEVLICLKSDPRLKPSSPIS